MGQGVVGRKDQVDRNLKREGGKLVFVSLFQLQYYMLVILPNDIKVETHTHTCIIVAKQRRHCHSCLLQSDDSVSGTSGVIADQTLMRRCVHIPGRLWQQLGRPSTLSWLGV